ncbi:hypothetical protein ISS40_09115 [Candidatus Bathyarchaeota archaeon]|nr:hypothetical protein [Candidatus Bathyarchaeota archaeon]
MRSRFGTSVLIMAFGLGLVVFYFGLSIQERPPAWLFSYRVDYHETINRLGIVEISEGDLKAFPNFKQAIEESNPLHPVSVSNSRGRRIFEFLGGEETDLLRARSIDQVYCYSIEVSGSYYNICIIFLEDVSQASIYGAYWVAGWTH